MLLELYTLIETIWNTSIIVLAYFGFFGGTNIIRGHHVKSLNVNYCHTLFSDEMCSKSFNKADENEVSSSELIESPFKIEISLRAT